MLGTIGPWVTGGLLVVAAAIATLLNWRRIHKRPPLVDRV